MRSWLFAVLLGTGCYHPTPPAGAPCNSRGECPSGLECVDDVCQQPGTLAVDAAIDACPETACMGDDLAACGVRYTCALGCADGTTTKIAHCMEMVPSNGVTTALLVGATADLSGLDYDFNTDDGTVTKDGGTPVRAAGPGVINGIGFTIIDKMAVFSVHSADVAPIVANTDDWDADGANAFVLYSATTITVAGRIDAGANGSDAGPAGSNGGTTASIVGCRGRAGLWQAVGFGEGGGGGGGRTAGGNGAPSALATFGAGGPQCALPTTIPLRGAYGGGAGGYDNVGGTGHGGVGGGGGGAMGLVAMESITISGQVTSPGEGGKSPAGADGGGGGGAGGSILLESPVVTITGALTANGGGGGGPSAADGTRGHTSDGGSAGGGAFNGGAGGRGGTGSVAPQNATTGTDATPSARGGGGGGAAGRTEIRTRSRTTVGAVLSPGPALGDITTQ